MPVFASANNLKPFIDEDLRMALVSPILYRPKGSPGKMEHRKQKHPRFWRGRWLGDAISEGVSMTESYVVYRPAAIGDRGENP